MFKVAQGLMNKPIPITFKAPKFGAFVDAGQLLLFGNSSISLISFSLFRRVRRS
jgi:hypothetical protein